MTALLGQFVKEPKDVHFDGQDSEEKIILFLRQHVIVNVRWIVIGVLLIFAPSVLSFLLSLGGTSLEALIPAHDLFVLRFLFPLFTFGYFFENFLSWYFNSYIVSDRRVIDIDFYGITHRRFSEAPLRNIEDITNEISGFGPVIFHYGNVSIQTAGEMRELVFENVPKPDRVQDTISDLIVQIRGESE